VTRVAREVGTEGKLGGQADVQGVAGHVEGSDRLGELDGEQPHGPASRRVRRCDRHCRGDLTQKITVDVRGEIRQIKDVINIMVDQLVLVRRRSDARRPRGRHRGKLGGQAQVKGVSGTWKDLTDNVNFMAGNLTSQVRGIAKVVTAVANGDLARS
jgi:HAMP domain-containing protein